MSTPLSDLRIIQSIAGSYSRSDSAAYVLTPCPNCAGTQSILIAHATDGGQQWLRCINCHTAIVANHGTLSPGTKPLREPAGLLDAQRQVWDEVRNCLSVGANTAAVMMCRKLLLSVAVSYELPAKDDKDRSPDFATAVKHLEQQGIITAKMRPWVDRIKNIGNEANHELDPIQADQANDVALFTEQLLKLAYEMDTLMTQASPTSE